MLNYENTQLLLLIGARKKDIQEELEIDLSEEKETENTAELFKELRIKRRTSASETTIERRVSRQDRTAIMSQEVRRLSREEAPGRGGKVGARRQQLGHFCCSSSQDSVWNGFFPKSKSELVSQAE